MPAGRFYSPGVYCTDLSAKLADICWLVSDCLQPITEHVYAPAAHHESTDATQRVMSSINVINMAAAQRLRSNTQCSTAPCHLLFQHGLRSRCCRDECVSAHLPDQQWELVLQSLRASGNNESQLHNIPAAVVVEAGILVRTFV